MPSFLSISSFIFLGIVACGHRNPEAAAPEESLEDSLSGEISYPFVKGQPLGVNGKREPFVIRSRVGQTEYAVEIPDAGEEYNIELPLAALQPRGSEQPGTPEDMANVRRTDRELTAAFPQPKTQLKPEDLPQGEAPSYVLGLAKINELYKRRQYEYALVEIDHLITFFPNSPKLYKMKGTVLIRTQDYALADKAWTHALELEPTDRILRRGLQDLRTHRLGL